MTADPPRRAARYVGRLSGWRRVAAALLLGLAAFPSMPPFHLVPMLALSLTGLIWLLDGAECSRRAFADTWLWGMGFFVPSLSWIAASMFVDIGQFWWMVPFSILGLPAFMSLYAALAMAAAHLLSVRSGAMRLIVFAAWWTLAEWLRGHCLTGFPWLLAGYVWSGDAHMLLSVLQADSVIGIYCLGFATVLIAVLPALLGDAGPLRQRMLPVFIGASALIGCAFWGSSRMAEPEDWVPDALVRILATDLPQQADPTPSGNLADFNQAIAIARRVPAGTISAAVWPEGDVPFPLNIDASARLAVGATVPAGGVVLAGTVRVTGQGSAFQAWNALSVVAHDGALIGSYDKHHLVPFGEYVPLHRFVNFSKIAADRFDFSTGPGPVTLPLPNLPAVAPIICYEAIFPDEVVDEAHRPGWMVNVTDDGWFGATIGPAQHFAISRARAVEEGLPLIRAANGGVSALVDPYGRRLASLPRGVAGTLDMRLPMALPVNSFYALWHKRLLVILIVLPITVGLLQRLISRGTVPDVR